MIFNAGQRRGESGPKLPPVGKSLESCSWAEIDLISKAGLSAEYFLVGDQKNIKINGVDYAVEIVGFNHDDLADGGGKAGITFGLKNCLNTTYSVNSTKTNEGGWDACLIRKTTLPAIYNQLKDEMRAVIKTVKKKATIGKYSSTIHESSDTLFMFAEIEVFGHLTYSYSGEGSQYSRFATSAARVKTLNGGETGWWLRSPSNAGDGAFCIVTGDGGIYSYDGSALSGLAFGFCV